MPWRNTCLLASRMQLQNTHTLRFTINHCRARPPSARCIRFLHALPHPRRWRPRGTAHGQWCAPVSSTTATESSTGAASARPRSARSHHARPAACRRVPRAARSHRPADDFHARHVPYGSQRRRAAAHAGRDLGAGEGSGHREPSASREHPATSRLEPPIDQARRAAGSSGQVVGWLEPSK